MKTFYSVLLALKKTTVLCEYTRANIWGGLEKKMEENISEYR